MDQKEAARNWILHDLPGLQEWMRENEGDNREILRRLTINLRFAIQHELTEKMRCYVLDYYSGLSMGQISEKYGVEKSTVSRQVKYARANLFRVLRYTDPSLLHASLEKRSRPKRIKKHIARKRKEE